MDQSTQSVVSDRNQGASHRNAVLCRIIVVRSCWIMPHILIGCAVDMFRQSGTGEMAGGGV